MGFSGPYRYFNLTNMKPLKCLLIILVAFLYSCGRDDDAESLVNDPSNAENNVIIDMTYLPDDVFESALIDAGYDDKLDDSVETDKVSEIHELKLLGNEEGTTLLKIEDFTGLEAFRSLDDLEIRFFELGTLPLEMIPGLQNLLLDHVIITESFNLTGLNELSGLWIFYGTVPVKISENPLLGIISLMSVASDASLEVKGNVSLEQFWAWTVQCNEFRVEDNQNLQIISGYELQNQDFVLTNSPILSDLSITDSNLLTLDLTAYPELKSLELNGNLLQEIDISGLDLEHFLIYDNPLSCIRVNELQLNNIPAEWNKDDTAVYALDCN